MADDDKVFVLLVQLPVALVSGGARLWCDALAVSRVWAACGATPLPAGV